MVYFSRVRRSAWPGSRDDVCAGPGWRGTNGVSIVALSMVRKRGFSLVELVIVVVIVGTIAAIAMPRVSRGAGAAAEARLKADLRVIRGAIGLYAAEHGGEYPSISTEQRFIDQMTKYSDFDGNPSEVKGPPFIFGPYLVSIPKLDVGEGPDNGRGRDTVGEVADGTVGWVYDDTTGEITANTGTTTDKSGRLLSEL